ncbi:AEC family transporter [Thermodesulfatator atlanticus]
MVKIIVPFICAYLLKRRKIFHDGHATALINYVIYFALPAIAFKSAYNIDISANFFKLILTCWLVTSVLIGVGYLTGKFLFKLKNENLKTWLLVISFGNTAFLGYPYTFNFFGEKGLHYAIVYDTLGSFVFVLTVGFFIAVGKLNVKEFISFPPAWGLVLGFLLRSFNLPRLVWDSIEFVIPSIFPVIIFAIGLSVDLKQIGLYFKRSLFIETTKIFLGAFLAILIGKMLGLSGLPFKVAILEASMPTMIFTAVLALKYKLNHNLAVSSVSLGILMSFLTTPFIVRLIHYLF